MVAVQVRAAHTGSHDPYHRVGRVLDRRVGHLVDPNVAGAVEERCSHGALRVVCDRRAVCAPLIRSNPVSRHSGSSCRYGYCQDLPGDPLAPYRRGHDNRDEVRDFLASRRAKITPAQAGLTAYRGNRRVPGLRREEVAMLAGVSSDYYIRLERGNLAGVSESVLQAIANALQLDEAERQHLHDLARAAGPRRGRARRRSAPNVPASVQVLLDSMTGAPAVVRNGRLDILATNALGRALYAPLYAGPRTSRAGRSTTRGSRSSTRLHATSGPTGTRPPTTPSASCACWPAKTRTTRTFTTWWGSCPLAARNFVAGGLVTTSISTAVAPRASTIRWSAAST